MIFDIGGVLELTEYQDYQYPPVGCPHHLQQSLYSERIFYFMMELSVIQVKFV